MKQHLIINKLLLRMARAELKLWKVSDKLAKLIAKLEGVDEATEENTNPNPHVWKIIDRSGLYAHMECSKCFENEEVALENMDEWTRMKATEECTGREATHLETK